MKDAYKITLPAITLESAEPRARAVLQEAVDRLGFIPNMYAAMVNSPGLLETYMRGYALFRQESGFTPAEQEVVFLSISLENECLYCMAAHSFIADAVSKVPREVTDAIRNGTAIPDARLAALHAFTRAMVSSRGNPDRKDTEALLAAGYSQRQILEIVLAVGVKTFSNYANHLFQTPLDEKFSAREWSPSAKAA